MAQQDQTYTFGVTGATQEHHTGNPVGSAGTNPKGPADAPIVHPLAATTVKTTNITTPYQKIVIPA